MLGNSQFLDFCEAGEGSPIMRFYKICAIIEGSIIMNIIGFKEKSGGENRVKVGYTTF